MVIITAHRAGQSQEGALFRPAAPGYNGSIPRTYRNVPFERTDPLVAPGHLHVHPRPKVILTERIQYGEKAVAQLAGVFGVHPNQISRWKAELLEKLPDLFSDRRKRADKDREETEAELYRQIGQLKVELDWLKKKSQLLLS